MKKWLMLLFILVVYYFTVFKILYGTFKSDIVVLFFSNLIALAFIYQWFKGQLYQL